MNGRNGLDLSSMSMLDIFQLEAETQCTILSDGLLSLEQSPHSGEVLERLMRSAHSVKGAARIIGLDAIVSISHAMEDVFVAAQKGECTVGKDEIDILFKGVDFLIDLSRVSGDAIQQWLEAHNQDSAKLVEDLKHLASTGGIGRSDDEPPPLELEVGDLDFKEEFTTPVRISGSMLELFLKELDNHSKAIRNALEACREDGVSRRYLEEIQKAFQSIKGISRIIGLQGIETLAGEMESCLSDQSAGNTSFQHSQLEFLQQLSDFFEHLAETEPAGIPKVIEDEDELISRLITECRELKAATASRAIPQPVGENRKSGERQKPKTLKKTRAAEMVDRSIRVSAEGMNRLMGLAGEVQVESRWLPEFSLKMLHLKHVQDEINRLQLRLREKIVERDDDLFPRSLFVALSEKIELSRNIFNSTLLEVEDHTRRSTEISYRLYHEVIANRMRPFHDGVRPFPRLVRDLSRELGKEVRLEIIGEDTRVDRDILEKIEAPLNHLVRNAIDHGIEFPEERLAADKQREATLRLEAHHRSGMLNILVSDDGRGIDIEKVRSKVIQKKMVIGEVARDLTENELLEFLFLPGFSTRENVSSVSGRGVGLDVVHSAVHDVRGIVRIDTKPGAGTTFEMQLPITLSVLRALMVEISAEAYAFPLVSIHHVLSLPRDQVKEIEGRPYITFNNERIGLITAQQILDQDYESEDHSGELPIIIISDRHNSYGLIVDRFLGVRDLVVQPLDRKIGKLQDISSAAILEDGTPVLIVDVEDMVRSVNNLISGNRLKGIESIQDGEFVWKVKRILVVDDSITVREVERKMLVNRGYDVDVAIDGIDALNRLRKSPYDLVVTDIDMPRMDGIELVTILKQDPKLKVVPIIIVSYKDRPEDRQKGLYAGADYYLTKGSFQDETLVRAVEDLIGTADEVI